MTGGKNRPDIHPFIHPPILALIHLAAAYLLGRAFHFQMEIPWAIREAGLGLSITGLVAGFAAVLALRKAGTTLDPHAPVSQLVERGIYRISRNPIYLGFLLMVSGFPLYSGLYWGILMAPVYALTMNQLVIAKEETYLEGKFPQQYKEYKSRVRRWL